MGTDNAGFWSKVSKFELVAFALVGVAATQVPWLTSGVMLLTLPLQLRHTIDVGSGQARLYVEP